MVKYHKHLRSDDRRDKLEIGKTYHNPVLLREVASALLPVSSGTGRDAWYLDATLGDGGHTIEILRKGGRVLAIDCDPQALLRASQRLKELGITEKKYRLVLGNFRDLKKLVSGKGFLGVLFDLGVSSLQLEDAGRGFSFGKEGSLDMRMDPTLSVRALDLVSAGGRKELSELFTRLGEEKLAVPIASALVLARPIKTTNELADLVEQVYRKHRVKSGKIHPATRVFQALRIAVNDELDALKDALPQALDLLEKKGMILVISFHSLEDRITKNTFNSWQDSGFGQILTKKPIIPSEDEIAGNPRARSGKLRIFQKA